jgi:hypothetical protein
MLHNPFAGPCGSRFRNDKVELLARKTFVRELKRSFESLAIDHSCPLRVLPFELSEEERLGNIVLDVVKVQRAIDNDEEPEPAIEVDGKKEVRLPTIEQFLHRCLEEVPLVVLEATHASFEHYRLEEFHHAALRKIRLDHGNAHHLSRRMMRHLGPVARPHPGHTGTAFSDLDGRYVLHG